MAAGRLRRCRRPRRGAGARAAPARRRAGARLRPDADRCPRARRPGRLRERQRRPADHRRRPRHGARPRPRRRRPLAHLVHQPVRPPLGRAPRGPARAHRALARAAAAVEGRAARRRLPDLVLARVVGLPRGGRDHRRLRRHAARRPRRLPLHRPGQGARRPQRHRHDQVAAADSRPTCSSSTASTSTRPYVVFVGRITRQKGIGHLLRAAAHFDPELQLVFCASAPDTPEIAAETKVQIATLQETPQGRLDPGARAAQRRAAAAQPRARVPLPVGLRAARHREPRGDGLPHRGRVLRRRRHPRGRGRRRDRHRRALHARRRGRLREALRRGRQLARRRPGAGPGRWATAGRERAVDHFGWQVVAQKTVDVYLAAGAVPGAVAP